MANLIRFDTGLDKCLYNDINSEVYRLYGSLHEKKENVPFTMHDLAEALVAGGYAVDEDKEHVSPYLGYFRNADYITLVHLCHGQRKRTKSATDVVGHACKNS